MALSRMHTSTKATEAAKLLLLKKHQVTLILLYGVWRCP